MLDAGFWSGRRILAESVAGEGDMGKSKSGGSSRRWLREHESDRFVQQARKEGYRSRASYKLLELDARDHFLKPGMTVVDLGAAPGGWSQIAIEKVNPGGRVIACDILPMDSLAGVEVLCGDFTEHTVLAELEGLMGGDPIDLVMSDMAPNISGMKAVDQPRAMYLLELTVDFVRAFLRPGGAMVSKVFQGEGSDVLLKEIRKDFQKVSIRKPEASRPRSREVYWVATGFGRN